MPNNCPKECSSNEAFLVMKIPDCDEFSSHIYSTYETYYVITGYTLFVAFEFNVFKLREHLVISTVGKPNA